MTYNWRDRSRRLLWNYGQGRKCRSRGRGRVRGSNRYLHIISIFASYYWSIYPYLPVVMLDIVEMLEQGFFMDIFIGAEVALLAEALANNKVFRVPLNRY